MAVALKVTRPAATADYRAVSKHRTVGFGLAAIGLMLAVVTLVANLVAADQLIASEESARRTLAWSFGLTTTGFGLIKIGIAVILVGILVRLWLRVDSVKASLPRLKAESEVTTTKIGRETTRFGTVRRTSTAPALLPIHRMARTMWAPMLVMGAMALVGGLVVSWAWAANPDSVAAQAWTQGLQFLGEGLLLSGIAFLLGSILAALRSGGGEVQESLGIDVRTLDMPLKAKLFVGLMMLGLMVSIAQFVLYLVAIGASDPGAWFTWLGPFREFGLGMILSGIVLALATIASALGFQFSRIREILTTGR